MSYPIDLDEYPDSTIRAEAARRQSCRERGVCFYCDRPLDDGKPCKINAHAPTTEIPIQGVAPMYRLTFRHPDSACRALAVRVIGRAPAIAAAVAETDVWEFESELDALQAQARIHGLFTGYEVGVAEAPKVESSGAVPTGGGVETSPEAAG